MVNNSAGYIFHSCVCHHKRGTSYLPNYSVLRPGVSSRVKTGAALFLSSDTQHTLPVSCCLTPALATSYHLRLDPLLLCQADL